MCHSENHGYVVHDALTILDGYQRGMFPPTECRTKHLFVCLFVLGMNYETQVLSIKGETFLFL